MKSRVPLFVLAVAVLAAGCEDTRTTAPPPQLGDPSKMIFDGAHHGGNPDFFFLPLIGPDARNSPNFDRGKFNATLTPVVKICKLVRPVTGNPTTRLIADVPTSICASGLPFATISDVAVFPTLEFYLAVWKTRNYPVDPDAFYRVQVWVGSKQLGFVDVTVVTSLREAKNAITGEVVPLADDFSLPIPFRIEAGALTGGASSACKGAAGDCVEISVKKAGGTFFTNTKWAGIQLQNGWASDAALALGGGSILLTIERVPSKDGYCHGGSESEGDPPALGKLYAELGGCYHYATDPDLDDSRLAPADRGFQPPTVNKVGQCTQALPTDEGAADADYLLFKSDPGQPITPLQDTPAPLGLNCTSFAFYQGLPSNPVLRFASIKLHSAAQLVSRFVVNEAYAWDGGLGGILPTKPANALSNISRGIGLRMARTSINNQSAAVGSSVDVKVRVQTEHLHAGEESRAPKAGVEVTFWVPDEGSGDFGEGGTLVTQTTDENGEAGIPWYLAAGTHTIYARAATIDPAAVAFTATGYNPIAIVSCPGTAQLGDVIDRGFYLPSYPSSSLNQVDLYIGARPNAVESNAEGTYGFTLTARLNTYDGTLLGTSTASVALNGTPSDVKLVSFRFPSAAVVPGTTVTFALTYNSRPSGGEALYDVTTSNATCPIKQTNETNPPLDTPRRNGIVAAIYGQPVPIP